MCAPKQKYGLEKGAHKSTRDCKNVEKTKQMETTIRQISNRKKKRDLYSVICVCETIFVHLKKVRRDRQKKSEGISKIFFLVNRENFSTLKNFFIN